jgi:hypothetical protein
MTSFATSRFTMPAALAAANAFLGNPIQGNPTWVANPENEEQVRWLEMFRQRAHVAERDLAEYIHAHGTDHLPDHAAFLAKHGWAAQINQGSPSEIYLAAVLAAGGAWMEPGHATDRRGFRRACLKQYTRFVDTTGQQIVHIPTRNRDLSYLLMEVNATRVHSFTERDLADVSLYMVGAHLGATEAGRYEAAEVEFPMIDLSTKSDASYMIGLSAGKNRVSQAAEAFTLQMNHLGGMARAAAEIAIARGGPRRISIDGPFVTAVVSRQAAEPLFAAFCDEDSWKEPDLKLPTEAEER